MRQRARIDKNQKEIVDALRKAGCSVQHLHQIGHGCPDILVCNNGVLYLIEIKSDQKSKLTEDEKTWINNWNGPVHVAHSIEEAFLAVGVSAYGRSMA